ncbi:hypothetical protein QBC43DRAFT_118773 [Cladorrhinum sp. PSN259]|nr:hypothetical protein QBC43DRAFT_118773 [Cladorrhinum sp. PSN259]
MSRHVPPDNATDLANSIYDARDVAHPTRYPDLAWALGQEISHFTVEFLTSNPVKPHVVFKVNLANQKTSTHRIGLITAARISIESRREDTCGVCEIKLCNYLTQSHVAAAGFQFGVKNYFTLGHFMNLIIGMPDTDMTKFNFCEVRGGVLDGCRDWVTQA